MEKSNNHGQPTRLHHLRSCRPCGLGRYPLGGAMNPLTQALFDRWCQLTDEHPDLSTGLLLYTAANEVGLDTEEAYEALLAFVKKQKGPLN